MRAPILPFSIVGIVFGVCVAFWAEALAKVLPGFWQAELEKEVSDAIFPERVTSFLQIEQTPIQWTFGLQITLVLSGVAFLAVLLCMLWWFERYINRVEPPTNIYTYILDFGVVGMFALASCDWYAPAPFMLATFFALIFFVIRMRRLYNSPNATSSDRSVLGMALDRGKTVLILIIVLYTLVYVLGEQREELLAWVALPGAFSMIGIILTLKVRRRLLFAAEIHETAAQRFVPMEVRWPDGFPDNHKKTIRDGTSKGIKRFRDLFKRGRDGAMTHDIIRSRVHAEGDIWAQSYILSVSSVAENNEIERKEIENKAFMVAVSHWLDDLLDGRYEERVLKIINGLEGSTEAVLSIERSKEMFETIYEKVTKERTDIEFYTELLEEIEASTAIDENRKYVFFGLNRVALGSVIFGPRVSEKDREGVLNDYNHKLIELVEESKNLDNKKPGEQSGNCDSRWFGEVEDLVKEMHEEEGGIGRILLGLTTKTTQEIAMSSENVELNFPLSLLYSILYAPLLYFHDAGEESEFDEIVPLDTFHVDYELIRDWLQESRRLCANAISDPYLGVRRELQLKMAFKCFEKKLPEPVRDMLRPIYVMSPPPAQPEAQKTT